MSINTNVTSLLSLSAALTASLLAGCVTDAGAAQGDELAGLDETAQEFSSTTTSTVTPLPSFASAPNIQSAVGQLARPGAVAVVKTVSGFQIYRCEQGATAPEWRLRTPIAGFTPSTTVQCPSLNLQRFAGSVATYHYRSDFGGLLSSAQAEAIGLTSPTPATAPVWDFTFQASGAEPRHEVLAGRVLAQDTPSSANIPVLLLEVRGRSIDPGTSSALASASHVLRWNTRGGLAPAASACTTDTLGREYQSPYAAEYYFLKTGL